MNETFLSETINQFESSGQDQSKLTKMYLKQFPAIFDRSKFEESNNVPNVLNKTLGGRNSSPSLGLVKTLVSPRSRLLPSLVSTGDVGARLAA